MYTFVPKRSICYRNEIYLWCNNVWTDNFVWYNCGLTYIEIDTNPLHCQEYTCTKEILHTAFDQIYCHKALSLTYMLLINIGPRRQQTLSTFSLKYNCLTEDFLIGKELSTKKNGKILFRILFYFLSKNIYTHK